MLFNFMFIFVLHL